MNMLKKIPSTSNISIPERSPLTKSELPSICSVIFGQDQYPNKWECCVLSQERRIVTWKSIETAGPTCARAEYLIALSGINRSIPSSPNTSAIKPHCAICWGSGPFACVVNINCCISKFVVRNKDIPIMVQMLDEANDIRPGIRLHVN